MASRRFTFPKASEETKHWAALLQEEMKRWPDVRTGKMFGMVSIYRDDTIFALLPATRSLEGSNSLMIKRNEKATTEGKKWHSLKIETDSDLQVALSRLNEAYRRARP